MSQILKIAALQMRMGRSIAPEEFSRLRELGVDLACLPEYFFVPPECKNQAETAGDRQRILDLLADYSRRLDGVLVGGTLAEKVNENFYNACHIFDRGKHVGFYRKMHPMPGERERGIRPGTEYKVFNVKGIRLSVLICSDVLFPESFSEVAKLKPDLIANPTDSPYLKDDSVAEKQRRDRDIYIKGAQITSSVILKTCGIGALIGRKLQGRSLICNSKGIIAGINPAREAEEAALIADVEV